jgi:hypothetical protein
MGKKVRFTFGKDMSDDQMWEAFKKFAEGVGFTTKDTHNLKKSKSCSRKKRIKI